MPLITRNITSDTPNSPPDAVTLTMLTLADASGITPKNYLGGVLTLPSQWGWSSSIGFTFTFVGTASVYFFTYRIDRADGTSNTLSGSIVGDGLQDAPTYSVNPAPTYEVVS